MRTAIVHYWLLGMRGGEKVVEALCELYPDADIFTLFYEPELVSETIRSHTVHASFLNPFRRFHRSLLPFMPWALESFDLRGYDLVISSESGPTKGVLTSAGTRHVCYCHTPMRYLWELYPAYLHDWTSNPLKRAALIPLSNYLRLWDFASAARVDDFIANSENVRRRIWKTYRRSSEVIYPPVQVERFSWKPSADYFLIVSELVAYKQIDYAVRFFSKSGQRLRVAGSGPDLERLRSVAAGNVEFLGRVSDADLCDLYSHCRALIMPGEEDFGMTMVEALASGKPVIALGRGGAAEILQSAGASHGILYSQASESALSEAITTFEGAENSFQPAVLRERAQHFSVEAFRSRMRDFLITPSTASPKGVPAHGL